MKEHIICKRMTLFALCLVVAFSVIALPVHAQGPDEPSVKLFCTDNAALRCSVLILCWSGNAGAYPEHASVGDVPDVTLQYTDADGAAKTIRIEKDKILQDVYDMESDTAAEQCMPQLTVCLPMYAVYLPQDARVSVSAGAFLTAEGEAFPAVSAPISDFRERTCIVLEGKTEVLEDRNRQTVEGEQMQLYAYVPDADIDADIKAVWTQHLTLTDNGKPVEREYTLQGTGSHTVCASINPLLTAVFTITTVSEREAYRINTWYWGKWLWKAPLLLLGGVLALPLFLIIGGPLAGMIPGYMLAGGLQSYEFFFKSLFRTELLTQTYYFHEDKAQILAV